MRTLVKGLAFSAFVFLLSSCSGCCDRKSGEGVTCPQDTVLVKDTVIVPVEKEVHVQKPEVTTPPVVKEAPKPVPSKWVYREMKSQKDGSMVYTASLTAENLLEFEFPYDGGGVPTLTLRRESGVTTISLGVSKGQFLTDEEGNGHILAKFDGDNGHYFYFSEPANRQPNLIYIKSTSEFIKLLKNSKALALESSFFNVSDPLRTMTFNTTGLNWNY